jgi:excisionase family DNA binding protein
MEDENLTVEQVAKTLKVSRATVWNMCKRGTLPAFKLPHSRRWLISLKDLEKLKKELKKG